MNFIELQGVVNVRDLGGIPVFGGRSVTPGLFIRGGCLVNATEEDVRLLFGEKGVRLVVDLRCGWEREAKPDVEVDGVKNEHIPFYDLEKVGIEYTEPAEGTKVVGRDVACNPQRFYRSLANPLTVGQMGKALHAIADNAINGSPTYFHCSGGKDRAGIMALLVLTCLGAESEQVLEDYLLTNVSRDKHYDYEFNRFLRLAEGDERRARELTDAHRALPENLEVFSEAVQERYGGFDAFIRNQLGMDDERLSLFREAGTVL